MTRPKPPKYDRIRIGGVLNSAAIWVAFLISSQLSLANLSLADHLDAYENQQALSTAQDDQIVVPELKVPGVGGANATHYYLSNGVESLSQTIDVFFGDKRIYEEATGTYVQVRGSVVYSRSGEIDFDSKFRAKLDLPQLKKRANLIIESSDRRDDSDAFNRITTGTSIDDGLGDSDVSTTLQFFIKEKKRWNLTLQPGVKFSDPIESFIKLRFRRTQPLDENWLSRGTVEVGYYSRRGWENEWTLDLERDIGKKDFFRSTSTVLWREDFPGNQLLGQTFLVTRVLDPRQSIAFEVGTNAETRPNWRDRTYFSSIRFRRDIHRGWLFAELKPQILFARTNHFKAEPALVLTLEILLGAKYLDKPKKHANEI